jgi:hypothetical protein
VLATVLDASVLSYETVKPSTDAGGGAPRSQGARAAVTWAPTAGVVRGGAVGGVVVAF